tara:strand:- start:1916 stop:2782 length:867 start_codon:yes stop_codon:yes gene_type:complete
MKGIIDVRIDRANGEVVEFQLYNDIVVGLFEELRNKAHPSTGAAYSYSPNYVPKRIKVEMTGGKSYTSGDLTARFPGQDLEFKITEIAGSSFTPALAGETLSGISLIAGDSVGTTVIASVTASDSANYDDNSSALGTSVGASDKVTVTYTLKFHPSGVPGADAAGVVHPALNYVKKLRDLVKIGGETPDISLSIFRLRTGANVDITTGSASNVTPSSTVSLPLNRGAKLTMDVTFENVKDEPNRFQVCDADENIIYNTLINDAITSFDAGDTVLIDDFVFTFGQTDAT